MRIDGHFNFSRTPELRFGTGRLNELPQAISRFGRRLLVLTGRSFSRSKHWIDLEEALGRADFTVFHYMSSGEPSPALVDGLVKDHVRKNIEVVAAIGGGSVLDAGKAVSAMLFHPDRSVKDFLEGVGAAEHDGRKVPFIAVPTTAGTGSESTKNAVLSEVGETGFKKSLRHDNFVPDLAILDPQLTFSCPPNITAACGLDALTQLLEAYVSTKASMLTDALAVSGLECVAAALLLACNGKADDIDIRARLMYGAYLSGQCLANAGLGVVHGIASPLGGRFAVPHGAACGALLPAAVEINIRKLEAGPDKMGALKKYARTGRLLGGEAAGDKDNCQFLIDTLYRWMDALKLPGLGQYGISAGDLDGIVMKSSVKNNPCPLDGNEIKAILEKRL